MKTSLLNACQQFHYPMLTLGLALGMMGLLFINSTPPAIAGKPSTPQSLPAGQKLVDAPHFGQPGVSGLQLWLKQTPPDCPFAPSGIFRGIGFTGRHAEYVHADTWYPCWASDGNMYSPWTDGEVNGLYAGSGGKDATTGAAKIIGDDPLKLEIVEQNVYKSDPSPYSGRYPCGSLVYNGVWYYGTYCLHPSGGVNHDGVNYNWPWLGPFVGFRYSTDLGKTWTQTPCTPEKPLFGEHALNGEPVKIGSPHFVDFGRNMEYSPDGKAYLVAHGASDGKNRRFAFNSWITGDEIYLLRVTPSIANMNDASQYEFFDGAGWTHDFAKIKPIARWRDHMGCVTMTYNAPLKKYLLCVTDGGNTIGYFDSYILESDQITGPFKLLQYLRHFGEQGYFVNIPSKFISPDGRTLWLCYAANFTGSWNGNKLRSIPAGSRYGMCLQEVKLLAPTDTIPTPDALNVDDNIARYASVTASSVYPGYAAAGAVDGSVDGFPGDISREWASDNESDTAMLRLNWPEKETVDRVWLFDRPNLLDHITGGMLLFSDGSTIRVGALPDDAKQGLEVRFKPKTIKWLIFTVTATKPGNLNSGLAEIAVFRSQQKARQTENKN